MINPIQTTRIRGGFSFETGTVYWDSSRDKNGSSLDRPGLVGTGQDWSGLVRTGQDWSGLVRLGWVGKAKEYEDFGVK